MVPHLTPAGISVEVEGTSHRLRKRVQQLDVFDVLGCHTQYKLESPVIANYCDKIWDQNNRRTILFQSALMLLRCSTYLRREISRWLRTYAQSYLQSSNVDGWHQLTSFAHLTACSVMYLYHHVPFPSISSILIISNHIQSISPPPQVRVAQGTKAQHPSTEAQYPMHQTWRTELDTKAGEAPIPHEETVCWDGWAAPCAVSGVRKHIHSDV